MSALQQNLISYVLLAATLAGGLYACASLRIGVANSDPLWLDELHSVWTIDHDFSEVQQAAAHGNQAPLYFWILKYVNSGDLDSPIGYRWLSILSGILATLSAGYVVYYWSKSVIASTLTIWVTAIEPSFIFYGSEARPYALLMLIAIWQFFFFSKCSIADRDPADSVQSLDLPSQDANRSRLLVMTILTAILLLVHYTGLLLVLTEIAIASLLAVLNRNRYQYRHLGIGLLISTTIITLSIQFGTLSAIFDSREQWNSLSSIEGLLQPYRTSLIYLGIVPLMILLAMLAFSKRFNALVTNSQLGIVIICVLAWAITPILLSGLFHRIGWAPLAIYRYSVTGAVAFPIFAGLTIGMINRKTVQATLALLIVAANVAGPIPEYDDRSAVRFRYANEFLVQAAPLAWSGKSIRMRYESWDSVSNLIQESDAQILLFSNLLEDHILIEVDRSQAATDTRLLRYLKFPLTYSEKIKDERVVPRPSHAVSAIRPTDVNLARQNGECWLVIRGDDTMVERIRRELHRSLKSDPGSPNVHTYHHSQDTSVAEWLTVFHVTWDELPESE